MSFVIDDDKNEELLEELNSATKDDIVMTCSTHDEGSRIVDASPAKYKGESVSLIVLAACDEYGKLLREVEETKYHYKIRGRDVAAGVIPFLKSEETISGSSVSTALAAGLSSLILTCDSLACIMADTRNDYMHDNKHNGSRRALVKDHLGRMTSSADNKFVLLEKFGGIETPRASSGSFDKGGRGGPNATSILINEFMVPRKTRRTG
jgi:hypothetical protein